jgi:hypothetical protein
LSVVMAFLRVERAGTNLNALIDDIVDGLR